MVHLVGLDAPALPEVLSNLTAFSRHEPPSWSNLCMGRQQVSCVERLVSCGLSSQRPQPIMCDDELDHQKHFLSQDDLTSAE